MCGVGHMYRRGYGTLRNPEKAAEYFKMASEKGNEYAMKYYADMLYNGEGIPRDVKEAKRYYKMAAENGNKDAKVTMRKIEENESSSKCCIIF